MEGETSREKLQEEETTIEKLHEEETSIEKLHGGRDINREITWRERH